MTFRLLSYFLVGLAVCITGLSLGIALVQQNGGAHVLTVPQLVAPVIGVFVFWAAIFFVERARPMASFRPNERRLHIASVLGGGGVLAGSLLLALLRAGEWMDTDISQRAWGVAVGVFLMVLGNFIPKALPPVREMKDSADQTTALRRFTGASFFIAGLGYAFAWLVLEPVLAQRAGLAFCLVALALVFSRLAVHMLANAKKA